MDKKSLLKKYWLKSFQHEGPVLSMEAKEIGDLDHDRVIWEVVAVGHRLDVGVLEEDVDFLPDAPRFVEVPVEDLAVHHQDVEVHQEEQVIRNTLLYLTMLG